MSFREKNAWIATITTLVVWGYYFVEVWRAWEARSVDGLLTRFLICMGITAILLIGLNLWAARKRLRDFGAPPDELERRIGHSATFAAYQIRGWLLLALAGTCPWLAGVIAPAFPADPAGATAIFIANAILLGLVATEVLVELIHIVRFRMIG